MTVDEFKIIQDNIKEIEQIVSSHSMFKLSPSLREKIMEMGKKYKYISCGGCSGSVYAGVVHLYEDYLKLNKEYNNGKTKKGKVQKSGRDKE